MRSLFVMAGGLLLACAFAQADETPKETKDKGAKKVELTGKLRTGIVAVGAETTGAVLETKKGKFELDFGKDKELRQKAEDLNGKAVKVAGTLEIRKGVEVKERKIVKVLPWPVSRSMRSPSIEITRPTIPEVVTTSSPTSKVRCWACCWRRRLRCGRR